RLMFSSSLTAVIHVPMHLHRTCFFFNDPPTTELYTLSLHDALPILRSHSRGWRRCARWTSWRAPCSPSCAPRSRSSSPAVPTLRDRKSTRLNSSHLGISYAVFCLKKKR